MVSKLLTGDIFHLACCMEVPNPVKFRLPKGKFSLEYHYARTFDCFKGPEIEDLIFCPPPPITSFLV